MKKRIIVAAAAAGVTLAMRVVRAGRRVDFKDRVVAITGGSRGLGLVLARRFAEEGARIALIARDENELERARQDIEGRGAPVLTVPCNVGDEQDAKTAIELIVEHYGRLDVLINDAGIIQVGPMEHMQLKDYHDAMNVHLWGTLYTILAALPHMKGAHFGRIVNIASIGGKVAFPHMAPYTASKFATVGLSGTLRAELAKDGILVTTVCPGPMRTGSHLNATFKGQHEKEFGGFAALGGGPWGSMSAEGAARRIADACRHGDAQLTFPLPFRLLAAVNGVMPGLVAEVLGLAGRFMPGPTSKEGDVLKTGWDSRSEKVPEVMTRMADQATEDNNGLRGHAIASSKSIGERNGHPNAEVGTRNAE